MPSAEDVGATGIEPRERSRLDAAVHGYFRTLHAENLHEAIQAVRERSVRAVLVSSGWVARDAVSGVAALVRSFPTVPTVAVVARHDAASSQRLLDLGASGVRQVVDLSGRDGWRQLPDLVAEPSSPAPARLLCPVIPGLAKP